MSFQNLPSDAAISGGAFAAGSSADGAALGFEEIQSWLVAQLAELLDVDAREIDVREPFASFGLNSISAVSLSGDLEELLGRELPATLLWDYPTIEVLARHLSEDLVAAE